jgi:hypothetical protein
MLAWFGKPIFSGLKTKSRSSKAMPALPKAKPGQLPRTPSRIVQVHFREHDAAVPLSAVRFGAGTGADLIKGLLKSPGIAGSKAALAAGHRVGHIQPTGAVAEWLKAAVC